MDFLTRLRRNQKEHAHINRAAKRMAF